MKYEIKIVGTECEGKFLVVEMVSKGMPGFMQEQLDPVIVYKNDDGSIEVDDMGNNTKDYPKELISKYADENGKIPVVTLVKSLNALPTEDLEPDDFKYLFTDTLNGTVDNEFSDVLMIKMECKSSTRNEYKLIVRSDDLNWLYYTMGINDCIDVINLENKYRIKEFISDCKILRKKFNEFNEILGNLDECTEGINKHLNKMKV